MTLPKRSTNERLDAIEANQLLQVEALQLIMKELGIRQKLVDIAEKLGAKEEAHGNGTMG